MNSQKPVVAIVGAGVGGLATANLLAKAGFKVEIFESNSWLGGKMGLIEQDGFRFDRGPSWFLMPEVYEHYFQLLGTTTKDQIKLLKLKPAYQVFAEDLTQPIEISGVEEIDKKTFENIESGAAKALKQYLDSSQKIYELAISKFLYTDFEKYHHLVGISLIKHAPELISKSLRPIHSVVAKYFKSPILQQILEYPAVFLGSSPFEAPALYMLMSYMDFRQGVFYPEQGMHSVTESFVKIGKASSVTYHLNHKVDSIKVENGKAIGLKLENGKFVKADLVISNADLHFTQTRLLEEKFQDYPAKYWQKRQPGPSALLMYLGVKGSIPELKHHNLFFAKNWKANFDKIFQKYEWPETASIYVCKPSATDKSIAPKGHENLFVLVPLPAANKIDTDKYELYADKYLKQIAQKSEIKDLEKRIVYKQIFGPADFAATFNAWRGSALGLSHTLKQSAMFRPKTKSKKVTNLYFVGGNTQPGIGVPMCLISAELVYKNILNDHNYSSMVTNEGLN